MAFFVQDRVVKEASCYLKKEQLKSPEHHQDPRLESRFLVSWRACLQRIWACKSFAPTTPDPTPPLTLTPVTRNCRTHTWDPGGWSLENIGHVLVRSWRNDLCRFSPNPYTLDEGSLVEICRNWSVKVSPPMLVSHL